MTQDDFIAALWPDPRKEDRPTITPTQYDLARWLFELIEKRCGPLSNRTEIMALMYECITAVRPPK